VDVLLDISEAFLTLGRFVQHVHSQLKADIESHAHSTDHRQQMDADSDDGFDRLSEDDLRLLFVKHRSGDLVFFCDLG